MLKQTCPLSRQQSSRSTWRSCLHRWNSHHKLCTHTQTDTPHTYCATTNVTRQWHTAGFALTPLHEEATNTTQQRCQPAHDDPKTSLAATVLNSYKRPTMCKHDVIHKAGSTSCIAMPSEEDQVKAACTKTGEDRTCSSGDMLANRQTDSSWKYGASACRAEWRDRGGDDKCCAWCARSSVIVHAAQDSTAFNRLHSAGLMFIPIKDDTVGENWAKN